MDDCDVMSQRSSRVTSNSSVSGAVGTLHHGHHSHSHGDAAAGSSNHGNSRRGSKRSEPRYSILSNNVTHPIHADASVEERLLDPTSDSAKSNVIAHISPGYTAILNKFNTITDHSLLVTDEFMQQNLLLRSSDLLAWYSSFFLLNMMSA
jgi:hypothetical protein